MIEKTVEVTASSANSIEDAVQLAVSRAAVTLSSIHSVRVQEINALVENNRVARWKVTTRITFTVLDQLHE